MLQGPTVQCSAIRFGGRREEFEGLCSEGFQVTLVSFRGQETESPADRTATKVSRPSLPSPPPRGSQFVARVVVEMVEATWSGARILDQQLPVREDDDASTRPGL